MANWLKHAPTGRADPLARVRMEACSFACSYVPMEGGLVQFSYEHVIFLWEFHKEGVISPRWASQPNRASSPPYEQSLNVYFHDMQVNRWLHLSSDLWGISFAATFIKWSLGNLLGCDLFRRIDQKNFITTIHSNKL